MSSVTVLVDANNVGYTEHYANKLRSGNLETQAIFGYMRKMRELKQHYRGAKIINLWDGRAQWRFDMLPEYKSNRENDAKKVAIKKAYNEQKPYIIRALDYLGLTQMTVYDAEADDMAGYLSRVISAQEGQLVVLLSGDHDWMQLVKPGVVWRDPKDMTNLIRHDTFTDKTGYLNPLAFLEGKALQGDNSDTIPGIEWMGEKTAVEFLAQWGSTMNFFRAVDSGTHTPATRKSKTASRPHPEQLLASIEGRRTFVRNMKLMNLIGAKKPDPKQVHLLPGKLDRDALENLCSELAFFSVLKDMDNYFSNFES